MKKLVALSLILLIIIFFVSIGYVLYKQNSVKPFFPAPTPTPTPTPTPAPGKITFPNGDEKLSAGKTYTLKWSGISGNTTSIFLKDKALESQGESVSLVDRVYNVPNTGTFNYTIPADANGIYILEIGNLVSDPLTIEANKISYCDHDNLIADITTQGAAGNTYGTLKLTNLSSKNCSIIASNFINPQYNSPNISVEKQGNAGPALLTLIPNQTAYSQIHFLNGAQCSSDTLLVDVSFKYDFAPNSSILFEDISGNSNVQINVCKDSTTTQIDVWSVYLKPVSN